MCLMRYLPRTMRRQSRMKTITATTPPITAWSTPEDGDMAVGSSEERRGEESHKSQEKDMQVMQVIIIERARENG